MGFIKEDEIYNSVTSSSSSSGGGATTASSIISSTTDTSSEDNSLVVPSAVIGSSSVELAQPYHDDVSIHLAGGCTQVNAALFALRLLLLE